MQLWHTDPITRGLGCVLVLLGQSLLSKYIKNVFWNRPLKMTISDPWFGGKEETGDMTLTHNPTNSENNGADGAVGLPLFQPNI